MTSIPLQVRRRLFGISLFVMALTLGDVLFAIGMMVWPWLKDADIEPSLRPYRGFVLIAAAVLWSFHRGLARHPAIQTDYRQWLELTPWSREQPLPLGPVHLVWPEVVGLAIGVALAGYASDLHPTTPALVFGIIYPLVFTWGLAAGQQRRFAVAMLFLFPAIALLHEQRWMMLGMAGITYLVGWLGLRRSLAAFPWPREELKPVLPQVWPYQVIAPVEPPAPWPVSRTLVVSLLVAWWLGAALTLMELEPTPEEISTGLLLYLGALLLLIWGRSAAYTGGGRRSPISPIGRLVTRQLLFPKYDRVFIAPWLMLIAGLLTPIVLQVLGSPAALSFAAGAFVSIFLCGSVGPTRRDWYLTGAYQFPPRATVGASAIEP